MALALGIVGILIIAIGTLIVRGALFKPEPVEAPDAKPVAVDEDAAVARFQRYIQCKTVSYEDWSQVDENEFQRFRDMLREMYPEIDAVCTCEYVGNTGILYRWPGKHPGNETVLMAHYDVVPITEALWTRPAFEGLVTEGCVWGRGTLDTKGTLFGVMEGVRHQISEGFVPEHDIYMSFAGDEEVSGHGAPDLVAALQSRGVKPKLVLDEGGAIVENVFPGVSCPAALIGLGEKGYMDVKLSMSGGGGHASTPPPHTAVGELAAAVVALESHPFKGALTPPVKEMFQTMGRHSSFLYRIIFSNLGLFGPLLKAMFKKSGGELNAMVRTTVAATRMEGSKAYNVMPPAASVGLNLRLLETDTMERAKAYIESVVDNPKIKVTVEGGRNASPCSTTDTEGWRHVTQAILQTWPGVVVSPYLMLAGSDSRHYTAISDTVLRFSAMTLSKEERGMIHGNDERITIKALMETVAFYVRLIERL